MADNPEQSTGPRKEAPLEPILLIQALAIASDGFRHAEVIVQQRMYNFLFADSILILSWATVFSSSKRNDGQAILLALAVLGVVLSMLWAVFGARQAKFIQLHMDIICDLEELLPEPCRVSQPIARLQNGEKVRVRGLRQKISEYQLTRNERWVRSRILLVIVPFSFLLACALLLVKSFPS